MVSDPSFKNLKFSERYDIRYELGKGGMGVVLKARDKLLAKDVAIKLLKHKGNKDSIIRFHTEARACGRLKHKNILSALDFGTSEDGAPYLVMDFLDGKGLDEILSEKKRLPLKDALPIILEIVAGMCYAHSLDILHRDLKPSNIMLTGDENGTETVKIMDFGLAKFNSEEDQSLTGKGIIGSPKYLSPEQASAEKVDERTDIYSFGCTTFEILTGEVPLSGDTAFDTILLKQNQDAPKLNQVLPEENFPDKLESIVARCLSRDKNDRYKSFAHLRDDLIEFIDSGEVETDEAIALARNLATAETRSKPGKYAIYATIAIAATCVAVIPYVHKLESQPARPMREKKDPAPLPNADDPFKRKSLKCLTMGNVTSEWLKSVFEPSDGQYLIHAIMTSDVTGKTLEPITNHPIRNLRFNSSKLDDGTLEQLGEIKTLQTILILAPDEEVSITHKGLEALTSLPHLTKLQLQQPELTDTDLQAISRMKGLSTLSIQSKGYTKNGIAHLSKLSCLKTLDLGDSPPNECVAEAAKLTGITTFGLHRPADGQIPFCLAQIRSMPNLTGLRLTNAVIKNQDLREIDKLPKLAQLILDNSQIAGFDPIQDLRRSTPLHTVFLFDMQKLSPEQIVSIGTKPGLKQLICPQEFEKDPSIESRIRSVAPQVNFTGTSSD